MTFHIVSQAHKEKPLVEPHHDSRYSVNILVLIFYPTFKDFKVKNVIP